MTIPLPSLDGRAEASRAPAPKPSARRFDQFWIGRALGAIAPESAADLATTDVAGAAEAWALAAAALAIDEEELTRRLSVAHRLSVADLTALDARLAAILPESVARRHAVVPLRADNRSLWLATSDPFDFDAEQAIGFVSSRTVMMELGPPKAIFAAFESLYQPANAVNRVLERLPDASVETELVTEEPEPEELVNDRDPALEAPVAKLIDALISDAVKDGASDIHIEPISGGISVRYRVDGILKEVMRLPETTGPSLVRRIKILSKLDVTNAMRPQDGRMGVRVDGMKVDLRVSTVPIARRGEKVVIRILDKRHLRHDLQALGLAPGELAKLDRLLAHREGLILVTGPTGSGKTTTLYAALNQLKTGKVNITTVEDPVEYDIPDIAQIQVNESQGLTFASTLRSVLRQDPDVVLIGEIRDRETAEIAVQASMTGHLVLSTLHTNDAPSAATRMRDMGVDGFKLGSTLIGVVAQRLMRKLCDECAEPIAPGDLPPEARPTAGEPCTPRKAVGCKACRGSGFRGRLPIVEVMIMDQTIGRLIERGDAPIAIGSAARAAGMHSLWESGLLRVWDGRTAFSEVERVLGERGEEEHGSTAPAAAAAAPAPVPVAAIASPAAAEPAVAVRPSRYKSPGPGSDVAARPSGDGQQARILIVDDDAQMRRFVRMVLEREQYTVLEAEDGLAALELVDSAAPDLILMDLDMPRLDGMATLEELRERVSTSSLPVILLTARVEEESEALDKGASDFMAKPLQPKTLAARVRSVLRRAQAE